MKRVLTTLAAVLIGSASSAATLYSDRALFEANFDTIADPTGGMSTANTQAEVDDLAVGGQAFNRIPGAGQPGDVVLKSGMRYTNPPTGSFGPNQHGIYLSPDLSSVFSSAAAYALYNPVSESHTVAFDDGISSFGFSLHDPSNTILCGGGSSLGCITSSFTVTAFDMGGQSLGAMVVQPGLGGTGFFGIDGEGTLIGSVRVEETSGGFENEYFGDYVTGIAAPVPLPAGGALLLGGIAAFALLRRRKG